MHPPIQPDAMTDSFRMEVLVKILILGFTFALLFGPAIGAAPPAQGKDAGAPPEWAYPVNPPDDKPAADDGSLMHVPGSSLAITRTQALDSFNIPDWHPEGHPAMPEVVEHGRKPAVRGCGYCHLPNGLGRPENASLAGLPASYIEQQVADFRRGARVSSEPKMAPPAAMIVIAAAATDAEVKAAAGYFSTLKLKPWIRVVETSTVPKTHVSGSMLVQVEGGGTEPLGQRIIETPENLERTELRDAASGFIAYVPVGSVKKGEALVTTGGAGKTIQCAICHGPELRGLGPVPPLAGRSPSYIFRQLYDIQHRVRQGEWSVLMQAPVARLSEDDMVSIAAYLASRTP
jgi:cytochrome c553